MVTIAHYIRLFHSFVMRLGAWKLDPGYHSALDPECFNAAMQRVLTPLSIPTKERTTAPPGS
jgi:hypothetical protein